MAALREQDRPVGILDSGIGGFSVARQVQRLMPGEELLYLGDGAHIPYGNHREEEIVAMARFIDRCRQEVSCPVFNAIRAGADAVAGLPVEKVGVISTVFTHNSGAYPREILAQSPKKMVVLSCGCPDLARLVEHNLDDPAGMVQVEENLRQELDQMVLEEKIQCCVLGCTHYPLVADSIRRLYPGLPLVDPAEEMARSLRGYLRAGGLERESARPGGLSVYTTGDVAEYRLRAGQVGLERIDRVEWYPPMEL